MPFRIIKGTFHIKGYSPDGDSIRFQANNGDNWDLLDGPPAKRNARDHVQLRLEAIDTLETHFQNTHQPLELAEKALEALLEHLGITGVEWNDQRTRVVEANDGTPGYILSRVVEPNRRPVAFVFAGDAPEPDGSQVFLNVARVRQSVNFKQTTSGLAYVTYYEGLFPDLRNAFTAAANEARQAGLGVYGHDRTNAGFVVNGLQSIQEQHIILPKLFRRLAVFLETGGPITGFKEFLEDLGERMFIISTAHATHFDTVVEVAGDPVRMTEPPENLIFQGQ
jgi:endonuclease YncB( thermonuclease family)